MSDLQARLLAAHAANDRAALSGLYSEAAAQAADERAQAFFLTHAYVFALDAGLITATSLRHQLVDLGCEDP